MIENMDKNDSKVLRIFQNFGFLSMGKILGDVFTFLLFVVISRVFGQEGIGQYSFAMALTGFFMVFANFGLYNLSIKEMNRRTSSLAEYYGGILSLRLILSVSVFGGLLVTLSILSFPREVELIIAIIGAYQIIYTLVDGLTAIFVAHEEMFLAGLTEFSLKAVTALGGIMIVLSGGSLVMVLAIFPIVAFVQVLVTYGLVTKKYGRPRLTLSLSFMTRTLREAVPYAVASFLRQTSTRMDVILLGFILGVAAAGVYNAAYRVVFLLMLLSHFAGVVLFPLASRLYVNSRKELKILYHQSLNLIMLIGLPTSAGLCLVAPDLINLIFGEAFDESALLLRYLSWLILLAFLKSIMGVFLMACDREVVWAKSWWIAACLNVIGNLILIPVFGIKGAAIATLISDTVLVILFAARLRVVLGWPRIGSRLAMSSVATASFCVPFAFFSSVPLVVVIPASVLFYTGILVLFKDIRMNEFPMLLEMLRNKFISEGPITQLVTEGDENR